MIGPEFHWRDRVRSVVGRAGASAAGGSPPPGAAADRPVRAADGPDLRLAGLAVSTWLSALASLYCSAVTGSVIAVLAAAGALAGCAYLRRSPTVRYGWLVLAVLLGVVCGCAATAARLAVRDLAPIADLAAERATVSASLVLRDDPRATGGGSGRPPVFVIPAELSWLRAESGDRVEAPARVLVLASHRAWRHLLPGQRLIATGRLMAPRGGDLTAVVLSTGAAPTLEGRPSWFQRVAGSLRAGLQRACVRLPDEPGGLLPGLVVGDTSRLLPAVEQDFRAVGMTHLTAVSGSNVAIVVGFVLLLTRWCRAGPWLAAGACAIALVGFVILVRPSPSVVRAATMGAIGLAALAAGRPRAALPALCAAVTVLVVVDPELAADAGFALSVLATAGLLLVAPRWRDALRRRGVPGGVAEALAIPAAAQLACAPVVAGLSGTVSLVAVPANLLAVPAVAPATVLGVAAAVVSPAWAAGAEFAAWLGSWPAWWLVLVARYGARLPAGTVPWLDGFAGALLLAVLTIALLLAARRPLVRKLVAVIAASVVIGALPVRLVASGWPPSGWVAVLCAVGQGDAVVLPVGGNSAVVVDTGPEPEAVDGCLRRLGVDSVPLLVLSHFHADHVGGIEGVLRGRFVAAVVTPPWHEPAFGRDLVRRATASGPAVAEATAGWAYALGQVELTALAPADPMRGTRSDPNNNSLVVRARVRGVGILLAGDAENEEQRALLDRPGPPGLRAQVLKVAHRTLDSAPMRRNPVRAAIYVRISDDREGRGLGIARQEADCRALADRRGWTVAEVFSDNDVSATSARRRPAYERMIAAIEVGDISAVIVWDVDRLTRKPAELEAFIDLAERYGVQLASVGGEIDLATPQGRLTARIKGSVARHEAEQIQRRIRRKVEELAAEGRIANGGPRPFGYRRTFAGEGARRKILADEIEPAEAGIVNELAERALGGEPLRRLVRDLNARDIATSTGGQWSQQGLRAMLRSARIAGLREHRGQVVGKAVWPAIITVDQHEQLRAMLDAKQRPPGNRVRTHYLSGYVFCSACEAKGVRMRVCPQHRGKLKYKCLDSDGGCNGRVIDLVALRDLMDRYIVGRLSDERVGAELARREDADGTESKRLLNAIESDERRLCILQASLADGDEDELPEVLATIRVLRKRIAAARDELARAAGVPSAVQQSLGVTLEEFQSYDLDSKRACLHFLVSRILIGPAVRGLSRFDPARVDIVPAH